MAYRNKTYIAFDGDKDMKYYLLMTAWKANDGLDFNFHNAHDLNAARDSSQEESIKKQLRERFANTKVFIILIGESTRNLFKFVKWEIEVALKLDLPIIAVNLNDSRNRDDLCPPVLRDELAIYVPFKLKIIEYAMINWPSSHSKYKSEKKTGPYFYKNSLYEDLGL